jgi:hypothetical protein
MPLYRMSNDPVKALPERGHVKASPRWQIYCSARKLRPKCHAGTRENYAALTDMYERHYVVLLDREPGPEYRRFTLDTRPACLRPSMR